VKKQNKKKKKKKKKIQRMVSYSLDIRKKKGGEVRKTWGDNRKRKGREEKRFPPGTKRDSPTRGQKKIFSWSKKRGDPGYLKLVKLGGVFGARDRY